MIQAATLGQTFAMLSGVSAMCFYFGHGHLLTVDQDAKHLAIFDSYHGSMISVRA